MGASQYSGAALPIYRSYLVRLWQSNEQGAWRASAQCIQTGKTFSFGSAELLRAFLQAQLDDTRPQDEPGRSDNATDGQ